MCAVLTAAGKETSSKPLPFSFASFSKGGAKAEIMGWGNNLLKAQSKNKIWHRNNSNINSRRIQKEKVFYWQRRFSPLGTTIRWWTLPIDHVCMASPDTGSMMAGEAKWPTSSGAPGFSFRNHPPSKGLGGTEHQNTNLATALSSDPSLQPGQLVTWPQNCRRMDALAELLLV